MSNELRGSEGEGLFEDRRDVDTPYCGVLVLILFLVVGSCSIAPSVSGCRDRRRVLVLWIPHFKKWSRTNSERRRRKILAILSALLPPNPTLSTM